MKYGVAESNKYFLKAKITHICISYSIMLMNFVSEFLQNFFIQRKTLSFIDYKISLL